MSANAASTASCGEDGAAGSVLFTPPQPTDEALPDAQPGSQLAYEETEPIQGLCRLPSPGKLWSDSEEESDEGSNVEKWQSSESSSTQNIGSESQLEITRRSPSSASPRSPNLKQFSAAFGGVLSTLDEQQVGQSVTYSDRESEKESVAVLQLPRSETYRGGDLSPTSALDTTAYVWAIDESSTAYIDHVSGTMQEKRPVMLDTAKKKVVSKNMKHAPLYHSSSSEDEQPPSCEKVRNHKTIHRRSPGQLQTFPGPRPQAIPHASRQRPDQTQSQPASSTPGTRSLGSGLRARLQQAIARKSASSSNSQNTSKAILMNGTQKIGIQAKQSSSIHSHGKQMGQIVSGTISAKEKVGSEKPPTSGSRACSTSTRMQDDVKDKKSRTPQIPSSHLRTSQTREDSRPLKYGPINASQQRQTTIQPNSNPATDTEELGSSGDSNKYVASSNESIAISVSWDDNSPIDMTGISSSASPVDSIGGRHRALTSAKKNNTPSRPQFSPKNSHPILPTEGAQASLAGASNRQLGMDTVQNGIVDFQRIDKTRNIAKWQKQMKDVEVLKPEAAEPTAGRKPIVTKSTSSDLLSKGQKVQPNSQNIGSGINAAIAIPNKSNVAGTNRTTGMKAVQNRDAAPVNGKPPSVSSKVPNIPAKRPMGSILQSILSEVSTSDSKGTGETLNRTQATQNPGVRKDSSDKEIPRHSSSNSASSISEGRLISKQSDHGSRVAPSATSSPPRPVDATQAFASSKSPFAAQPRVTTASAPGSQLCWPGPTPRFGESSTDTVTQSQASQRVTPQTSSSAENEPSTPVKEPAGQSFTATRAPPKDHSKTHIRVPSGPTQDGFDIYIPPAPQASNPSATKDPALKAATANLSGDQILWKISQSPEDTGSELSIAPSPNPSTQTATSTSPNDIPAIARDISQDLHIDRLLNVAEVDTAAPTIASHNKETENPTTASVKEKPSVANTIVQELGGSSAPLNAHLDKSPTVTPEPKPHEALTAIAAEDDVDRADTTVKLPEVILRDRPKLNPRPESYFEYRIKQKIWPASGSEQDAETTTVGFTSTVLETANRHAEGFFTKAKHQYLSSFAVQHEQSSSAHSEEGCLELTGTLVSVGWPAKQVYLKVWVDRGEIPSDVAAFHPPPAFTPFLSKTLYIIRLYKLIGVPTEEHEIKEYIDGEDEAPVSNPDGEATTSSSDVESSGPDSGPDKGKHNKKRQAKEALRGSPPPKRRKVEPPALKPISTQQGGRSTCPTRIIRQHHQIPCPEVYTTIYGANSAACDLQVEIMSAKTLLGEANRASNATRLRQQLMTLSEKQGKERYWHNEFVVGLGGDKMEIMVEQINVCGPRNV